MRYGDQKLLNDYARLALRIAAAKNPTAKHDVSEHDTLRKGYQMLKARMEQLSPKSRERYRYMLLSELQAVNRLMAKAKATGEDFTLADIEINLFDAATRELVPGAPNVEIAEDTEPRAGAGT